MKITTLLVVENSCAIIGVQADRSGRKIGGEDDF